MNSRLVQQAALAGPLVALGLFLLSGVGCSGPSESRRTVEPARSPKHKASLAVPRSSPPGEAGAPADGSAGRVAPRAGGRRMDLRKFPPHATRFDAREVQVVSLAELSGAPAPEAPPKEWLLPPTEPFVIGPGDVLDIQMLGEDSRTSVLVCPDGKIYYNILEGLDVWGLDLKKTRELIESEMSRFQKVPKPRASITVRSVGSKWIWLLGRVQSPGVYPLASPMSLLEAITLAGGPVASGDSDLASLQDSFVMRQGQLLPVDFHKLLRGGDMAQNIYLQPDDFVYLPSAYHQQVHVLGAVRQPGAVPFREEMTLMSAIAGSGGHRAGAHLSQVAVVRGTLTNPKIAIVDLGDIQRGKATDVLLEPRDIIFVPNSPYSVAMNYLKTIVTTFVRTVAINEGVRAVIRASAPVSPVVNPN